jgi:tRNA A37 methylthiotransferase MiaB
MAQDPELRVDDATKQRREREIMMLQQEIAFEQAAYLAEQFDEADPENTGVVFDVLVDESFTEAPGEDGLYEATGRAYFQAPGIDSVTAVRSRKPLSPGELVRCTVVASDGYDLIARPREDLRRAVSLTVIS